MKKKITLIIVFFSCYGCNYAQVVFQKTYSGAAFTASFCNSVQQTADGGYIMAGAYGASGSSDACITKTNSNGIVTWSYALGGIRSENIYSVRQTANGGYIIAGTSRSFSVDSLNEFYVIRLDASGNVVWEKIYGSLAGTYEVGVHYMSQTSDGGYIIGGYEDALVGMLYLKTDSSGNISWGKFVYGSIGTYGTESIQQTSDGGYVITGNGGWLIKTDASGNITWSKSYINLRSTFAQQTSDGGYMMAGITNSYGSGGFDRYLMKTDASGNVSWCKTYGGTLDDDLRSAQQTADGGYVLAGTTYSFGAGGSDAYVVKTDASGNLLWSKTYGSAGDDFASSVQETSGGGYIIAGQTTSFSSGAYSVYLIRTDANGMSGCNEINPATLVTSPVIVATTLSNTASTYVPDTDIPFSSIGGGLNETLLCLSFPTGLTSDNYGENNFSFSPNPATTEVTINFGKEGRYDMRLCNTLGEILFQTATSAEQMKIDVKDFPAGIYFVAVRDEKNNLVVRKVMKM